MQDLTFPDSVQRHSLEQALVKIMVNAKGRWFRTQCNNRQQFTRTHIHRGPHNHNMAERKATIKNADMTEDMQQDAVECAVAAMEKFNIEKDIASYIKKEFDKKYNPTWHCIVGRNFGRCCHNSFRLLLNLPIGVPPHWRGNQTIVVGRDFKKHTLNCHCCHVFFQHYTVKCIIFVYFCSYVTHETKHFIYFYLGQVAVLLFKSG
ncbi:unnamed protein product [Protopolystoma xenopodis]|uniref:Dynein light chain 1, cytoplasmic n=1 Tax=Protopolystoma xenopodis TaxID=117903 RepID=A0A3S5AUV7_9PLAT|nr:unnamed protein product [Protopolystoma xenopodis]